MTDEIRRQEELRKEGYTGPRAALAFCTGLAMLGAGLGSVFVAIALNALLGPENDALNTLAGSAFGALLGWVLGYAKVREGNREALEAVEEAEWRRHMSRLERNPR